jgi:lysophospholipid acyltransferase (LPLAT)-like uncharacterized protein
MGSRPFTSRYLVDEVPLVLRPFHDVLSYAFGLLVFSFARLDYHTSRIEVVGRELINEDSNYIFCYWHVHSPLCVAAFPRRPRHVWMQHPGWLNKHMHLVVRLFGVRVVQGSTGFRGREAAEEIIRSLKQGCSTVVFPDAPRGPSYVLKDGVLHMSLRSGVPIAPVQFEVGRSITLSGWDRKRIPLPFTTIRIGYQEPIRVTEATFDQARADLVAALGRPYTRSTEA